jgi:hypothetical protein
VVDVLTSVIRTAHDCAVWAGIPGREDEVVNSFWQKESLEIMFGFRDHSVTGSGG